MGEAKIITLYFSDEVKLRLHRRFVFVFGKSAAGNNPLSKKKTRPSPYGLGHFKVFARLFQKAAMGLGGEQPPKAVCHRGHLERIAPQIKPKFQIPGTVSALPPYIQAAKLMGEAKIITLYFSDEVKLRLHRRFVFVFGKSAAGNNPLSKKKTRPSPYGLGHFKVFARLFQKAAMGLGGEQPP